MIGNVMKDRRAHDQIETVRGEREFFSSTHEQVNPVRYVVGEGHFLLQMDCLFGNIECPDLGALKSKQHSGVVVATAEHKYALVCDFSNKVEQTFQIESRCSRARRDPVPGGMNTIHRATSVLPVECWLASNSPYRLASDRRISFF